MNQRVYSSKMKKKRAEKQKGLCMTRTLLAALLIVLSLQGCTPIAAQQAKYNEAPMLVKLVSEGKLPPVEERLPTNPTVVPVVERIGEYGGTMYAAIRGMEELSYLQTTVLYDPLIRWNPENNGVAPGLALSWEMNEDATVYTFTLRKGLKWSDGQPFTTDDLVFYVNDVAKNQKLPKAPMFFNRSGKWSLEKVDDYIFRLTFEKPNVLLEEKMAAGYQFFIPPAHYAKQFHIKYNPDADTLAKEAGFENWVALFKAKTEPWTNPECPVLSAWVPQTPLKGSSEYVVERNPYYWKTDPQGNQLPYIDRIIFHVYKNPDSMTQRTLNGEIDFMDRSTVATIENKSRFADNQEAGKFRLTTIIDPTSNVIAIGLNQTIADPVLREIFRNKSFRIGLSYAINRQEIIETVYKGQGEPWQTSPRQGSGFYNERLAKQYTEYDVELANKYFDEAGFASKDADGWRLGPDDKRIEFDIITRKDQRWINDTMKLVIPAWRKVGIYASVKSLTKPEWKKLKSNNQAECMVTGSNGGWTNVIYNPSMHIPTEPATPWGGAWNNWYDNAKKGDKEEPVDWVKQGLALYDKVLVTLDKEERSSLMHQILDIAAENFPVIGIALPESGYGVVNNRLRNVPMEYQGGCLYAQPAASNMSQFFLEGGSSVALGN